MPRARDELLSVDGDDVVEDARSFRKTSACAIHHQHELEVRTWISLTKLSRVAKPEQEVTDRIEPYDEHCLWIVRSRFQLDESVDWIENDSPEPVFQAVVESENESLPFRRNASCWELREETRPAFPRRGKERSPCPTSAGGTTLP